MNEPKPFASLGPTLLARKGGAKPAMRPQLAPMGGVSGNAQTARALAQDFDALEDLGWNDMGEDDVPADRSAEVLQLTPSPHNVEAEAETDSGSPKARIRSVPDVPVAAPVPAPVEDALEAVVEKPVVAAVVKPASEPVVQAQTAAEVLSTKKPRVRSIHEELAEMLEKGESAAPAVKPKPEPKVAKSAPVEVPSATVLEVDESANRRAAFTLRLDAKRHLKLRLASTVRNRSAQQLVTEALDRFLKDIPEVELLARNIQHTSRKKG